MTYIELIGSEDCRVSNEHDMSIKFLRYSDAAHFFFYNFYKILGRVFT